MDEDLKLCIPLEGHEIEQQDIQITQIRVMAHIAQALRDIAKNRHAADTEIRRPKITATQNDVCIDFMAAKRTYRAHCLDDNGRRISPVGCGPTMEAALDDLEKRLP